MLSGSSPASSPWGNDHDSMTPPSEGYWQGANDVSEAACLAPGGDLGRHEHNVHGVCRLRQGLGLLLAGLGRTRDPIAALRAAKGLLIAG